MFKMSEKKYFSLFIFCAIFAQGIFGTFLEDGLQDSTNSLIRQKRVINREPGGDVPFPSAVSTHTVRIKFSTNPVRCLGTILSARTVITAARCMDSPQSLSMYTVVAGSSYARNGSVHNVVEKRVHGNHPVQGQNFENGIALIYVNPPFQPRRGNIQAIGLHSELLLPGTIGTIRGWGTYYYGGRCQSQHVGRLRAIEVPIINQRECVNNYRGFFEITDAYFCTHHVDKQCAMTDTGTGFIIENSLAGIYLGVILAGSDSHLKPDVFIMLQHSDYRQWIVRNIEP